MREEIKAYRDDNTLNSNIRCIEIFNPPYSVILSNS